MGSETAHPTMAEVALRAGVSVSTVSRALRHSPLVSAETRQRVDAAARDLGFAVSRAGSSLATGRTGRVAVLVGGRLGSWFNGTALEALSRTFAGAGLDVLVFSVPDLAGRRSFFDRLPAQGNADALVVLSFAIDPDERAALDRLGIPLAYLNQQAPGADSVLVDDRGTGAAATSYLINLGHRRLAYCGAVSDPEVVWSADVRAAGFVDALVAAGLDPDDQPVLRAEPDASPDDVLGRLLSRPAPPTAVLVETDEQALGLLAAAGRARLPVPAELSVIGIDDHQLAAAFGLTTMAQPVDAMATRVAELTIARLTATDPEQTPPPATVLVDTTLIVRHTTAAPPTR